MFTQAWRCNTHSSYFPQLILAWCRIYTSWKTALISLVTHICVANPSISLKDPGGDLQNSVRPRWVKAKDLIMQHKKFQIYTLKINTIIWNCNKNSDYFWTRVYFCLQCLSKVAHLAEKEWRVGLLQTSYQLNKHVDLRVTKPERCCSEAVGDVRADVIIVVCKRTETTSLIKSATSLRWRHNERAGVSNHQRLDC